MSTPVQRQYAELKSQNPEAILFFRLGDFYEMFQEDALIASRVLGITLTARHKGTDNEMPMCGFPHHAHQPYLETLIKEGYKVAVAEQVTNEEGQINRVIDRVITPGTTLQEGNLAPDKNNFLVSIQCKKNTWTLAYTDSSTGIFAVCQLPNEIDFWDELYRLNPQEILCPNDLFTAEDFVSKCPKSLITPRSNLKENLALKTLEDHFPLNHLETSGLSKLPEAINAAAQLLKYLQETHRTNLTQIQKINVYQTGSHMILDRQTATHLEIFYNLDGSQTATVLQTFDRPKTAMGGRMLRSWLAQPLLEITPLNQRSEAVELFTKNFTTHQEVLQTLSQISDLERLLVRLVSGKGSGRDLAFLRDSLVHFPSLQKSINDFQNPLFLEVQKALHGFENLYEYLKKSLVETPPIAITEGGIFQKGFHPRLDELQNLTQNSNSWLNTFVDQEKNKTGITNLRVKYSKNFGFCLEVSARQAGKAPESWTRKQTLVNAERFTTPELLTYETEVLGAEAEMHQLEHELFVALRDKVLSHLASLQEAAHSIGILDTISAFAATAQKHRWTRPHVSENQKNLIIKGGRHPIVEGQNPSKFIPNGLMMIPEESQFHLISGPNMAGKSTFLRQNALIILLGQIGSFVPAQEASWGLVDRIFTRVGASDNLAEGKSTFFVEMTECAHILQSATEKSFIILDEIGRGTSTFDGLSIAWAVTEFLHNETKAKTLFATHYHELIDLGEHLTSAKNYHIAVGQNNQGLLFLHEIRPGGMADSFGIEVARLAGIPSEVIDSAQAVLKRLETENKLFQKPNLFTSVSTPGVETKKSEVEAYLENIKPDELSPKEALEILYTLKKL